MSVFTIETSVSQLSVAVAFHAAISNAIPGSAHSKTKSAGHVIVGGVQSETTTWKLHDAERPLFVTV